MRVLSLLLGVAAFVVDCAAIGNELKIADLNIWACVLTVGAILAYPLAKREWEASAAAQHAEVEAALTQRAAFFARRLTPKSCALNLESGENCYWSGNADEVMAVKHSQRVGYYGGPSVRVASGVYMRAGTSRSHTESRTAPEVVDRGTLYLTNERVIFTGIAGTKTFAYKNALRVDTFTDGFSLDMPNSARVTFVTHEPSAAWTIDRISRGAYDGAQGALATS